MKQLFPEYEFPIEGRAWTQGAVPTAGVLFLNGGCHIVARHGDAERDLLERGALLIAVVRFDDRPDAGRRAGSAVRAVPATEALARFALAGEGPGRRRPTMPDRPPLRPRGIDAEGYDADR